MKCDLGINSLSLRDSTALDIPLACSFDIDTLSCSLVSNIDSLKDGNYLVYYNDKLFCEIKLVSEVECN